MIIAKEAEAYLEYCKFRKELDEKTLKAYRIDLRQYTDFLQCDNPSKARIEEFILSLIHI